MKRFFIGFVSLVFIFGCCLFLSRLYNKTESVSSSAKNRGLYIILDAGHPALRNTISLQKHHYSHRQVTVYTKLRCAKFYYHKCCNAKGVTYWFG